MPASSWDTYRLGARLPALRGLQLTDGADQIDQLQRALSSVACIHTATQLVAPSVRSDDDVYVGRVLLGLLCRGWPTHASPAVEHAILASITPGGGLTSRPATDAAQVGWTVDLDSLVPIATWNDAVITAMLRGDRRLTIDEAVIAELTDSGAEARFYRDHLSRLLGPAIGWLELQRPIASMIREDAPSHRRVGSGRVDFSLDLPGASQPVRFVIELDGPHHLERGYREQDRQRDKLLRAHGWETVRVPVSTVDDGSLNHLPEKLQSLLKHNPFPFTQMSDSGAALDDSVYREAVRLVLTPHAVARVQLALCRGLMDGVLSLSEREWAIAVAEREVPCAELAIGDWLDTVHHLCRLYEIPVAVERVRLVVIPEHLAPFPPLPWTGASKCPTTIVATQLAPDHEVQQWVNLAIDVSVGAHVTRRYPTDPLHRSNLWFGRLTTLRTAQRQSGYRVDGWPTPRPVPHPSAHEADLMYFLQLLFRKQSFRTGQMPILDRVLRRADVIGLLPTGAGKSITYQLPALLSPGLSLVIDPIKSLMQDQVDNLAAIGIQDAIQINSDTTAKDRARIEWQFGQGEFRLVFISPERLQIQSFRDLLASTARKRKVAMTVIDEAHCVSEWGHDFRPAYLNLGRIAAVHLGVAGARPPMIALTGTASESVLRDIQRELDIPGTDAIVRPKEFDRKELKFHIVRVPRHGKQGTLLELIATTIPDLLNIEPSMLVDGSCGGIVFCPHRSNELGVYRVAESIRHHLTHTSGMRVSDDHFVGYYAGEPPNESVMDDDEFREYKQDIQRSFKAGRTPVLVATKAFGMGIDKPNIRYTIHYAMAGSVEAFAQEAGRAGRDRKPAICAVLFTDDLDPRTSPPNSYLKDCLEPGISTEEAKARVGAAGKKGDDAVVQMFLHGRSYLGVQRESAVIHGTYEQWIRPALSTPGIRQSQQIISRSAYRAAMKQMLATPPLSAPAPNDSSDRGKRPEKQSNSLDVPDLPRVIYRLSVLGVIDDYTVRYQTAAQGNDIYELSLRALDAGAVKDNLFRYIRRYRTSEGVKEAADYFDGLPHDDPVARCIDTLCWFVYNEIEQRRRQAMDNMRLLLRESVDGADLARRINAMLSTTALTQTVFEALRADDYHEWRTVSEEITSADTAEHVRYQCRRALEDAPGHPGLLLLVALAEQGAAEGGADARSIRDGLHRVRQVFTREAQQEIGTWLVEELVRISPERAPAILREVLHTDPDTLLPVTVLRAKTDVLSGDSDLVRSAQRRLLHSIDLRLTEFLSA